MKKICKVFFRQPKVLSLPKFNLKKTKMKIKGLVVFSVAMALVLGSCSQGSIKNAKMQNADDSLAYAFGIVNYNALTADSLFLNPAVVAKAMLDGRNGEAEMDDETARSFIMMFISQREEKRAAAQEEQNKILYKEYIDENVAFLDNNKSRAGVMVTETGLQYEVVKMGNGAKPTAESVVKVHYTGTLIDGTKFDSSVERGEPTEFPVSGVIAGWTEALQLMPAGSKFKLFIPQELAYGANGVGDMIKPFSTLVFEVELLEIVE